MPFPHYLPHHEFDLAQPLHKLVPAPPPDSVNRGEIYVNELAAIAIAQTDFVSDLDPATLTANAENSADLAADIWSDEHDGQPVPLAVIVAARRLLVEHGYLLLCEREQAEIDALADAQDAGDADRAGNFIPYPRYP